MKKVLYCLIGLLLVSCYNDKEFYSLHFEKAPIDKVTEKLRVFQDLVKELSPTQQYSDHSGPIIVDVDSGRRSIVRRNKVVLNFNEIGKWDSIKTDTNYLYNLPELQTLGRPEKKQFWNIFQFLIANEINGAYNAGNLIVFPFRQHPFANRHYMYIVLEDEYERLSDSEKNSWLENELIIDRKGGLVLLISNKARFLRYVYGSDADVPEEWTKPTEKVFREHAR